MSFEITTITAFIAKGADGVEGVIAHLQNGTWIPLICADEERVKNVYPLAVQAAKETGK